MPDDKKESPKPTKSFLMSQIEVCRQAIHQNQGAMNLCMNMLNNGCFVEEEKKEDKSEA